MLLVVLLLLLMLRMLLVLVVKMLLLVLMQHGRGHLLHLKLHLDGGLQAPARSARGHHRHPTPVFSTTPSTSSPMKRQGRHAVRAVVGIACLGYLDGTIVDEGGRVLFVVEVLLVLIVWHHLHVQGRLRHHYP